MAKNQYEKSLLSKAGEHAVCSELLKHHFDASITEGNCKATDIVIFDLKSDAHTFKTVEVKTSRNKTVVTNFFQKYGDITKQHPDYWVIVHIDENDINHYYIFTHQEIGNIQIIRNKMTGWYSAPGGCDNIRIADIIDYENKWETIKL